MPTKTIARFHSGKVRGISTLTASFTSDTEEAIQYVPDRHSHQPAGCSQGDGLGSEDATDVSGACANRTENADLTGALDHSRRERVCEAGHADCDDQEADCRERGCQGPVVRYFVGEFDVLDLAVDAVAVCNQGVFDPPSGSIDKCVIV